MVLKPANFMGNLLFIPVVAVGVAAIVSTMFLEPSSPKPLPMSFSGHHRSTHAARLPRRGTNISGAKKLLVTPDFFWITKFRDGVVGSVKVWRVDKI